MTVRHLATSVLRLLVAVVLVVSGFYLLVYLYRWEWNRAIVSGLFFVASEVALATAMLSRRLRALEARGEPTSEAPPSARARLRSTPVDRPDPFAWLRPRADRMDVFVPVLLGAGAILSTLAFVVERVAEVTAVPMLDRRLGTKLAGLAPPPGGLSGRGRSAAAPAPKSAAPGLVLPLVAVGALVLLVWLGIDALGDATASRPDQAGRPATTTIELTISHRDGGPPATETTEALWIACRATLGSAVVTPEVVPLEGNRVRLVLTPGIGELRARRLTGCLGDLQMDRVLAHVLTVESSPPPS